MSLTRRRLLAAVSASTGALAGCLSGDGGGEDTTTGATTTESATTETSAMTSEATTAEPTTTPTTTAPATTASGGSVVMQDRSFTPRTLSIEPGETVTWTNADTYGHDVTSAQFHDDATSWSFESDTIDSGGSTSYTFEDAGVYEYYCTIHGEASMCGAVLVGDVTLPADLPCSGGGYGRVSSDGGER